MILWEDGSLGRASIIGSISKHAHSEEALQILITTYWWREMQKKKIWIRFKGYHPSLTTHPFHYRLRWRLGRFFSVKKDVHLSRLSDLWQGFDYDFWPKKLQQIFREWNCRYCAKRLGKQEGCLSESWLFVWWVFLVSWEKKLKIATFTEAPFMVKLDFWNNKYFFLQIFAQ